MSLNDNFLLSKIEKIKMSIFKLIAISIIFLEEFVKRTLIGVYYMWQKFDYWNFNRKLPK